MNILLTQTFSFSSNCNQKVHETTSFSKETSSEVVSTKYILFPFSQTNSKSLMDLEIVGRHALFFEKI
ncbi:hypothetical protein HID58_047488 [Brassica napus]|uniref:Uncharacterized protein n=1 Tax=Brassica napus TaxID=3708 RepID=A0ABQ8AZE4_BRANA|nr:hypothetical protein HID58_047488 [Brassica napus]